MERLEESEDEEAIAPLQEKDEHDGEFAIGLRKGMNARCVNVGLNKG
jgi:hypothetical protein